MDNDGDLDLATVGSVRLNNGRGVFSGGFEIGMPGEPKFGDIDGDGDLDLLTAGGTVSVYVNNGLGAFSNSQQIAANSYDMAVCDVDGDGDLDLLTAVNNSAILTVYLNNGMGVFSAGQIVALDAQVSNNGVAVGDLNGDNTLDFLVNNVGAISVRLNQLLPPVATTRRLNAGGPALSASQGQFVADQYYSAASATTTTTAAIAGTLDDALYQSERYSTNGQLSYAVPVANGTYSVVLHFAETYWTRVGQRVFNIGLEGRTVRTNYDIVAKVGPNTATTETFVVNVTDGVLNLDLSVPYLSGGQDQAKLSALEVLPVTAVARLNVGSSSALSTSQGTFSADTYYQNTGGVSTTAAPIAGTEDDALYQSERYSTHGQLSYVLSVPNGTYTVALHFAEIYWTQPGQRVFNIELEGNTVRTNYDIVAEVGPLMATTETFTVQVTDGQLNIDLRVPYASGGADQAKLSALEVFSGGANGSNRPVTGLLVSSTATRPASTSMAATLQLYPNPSQGSFTLSLTSAKAQAATLVLTDRLGRVVREQAVTLQAGSNQLQLRYLGVREGLYQLTLRTADGQRLHQMADIRP